ncbi:hypothetical protein EWE75_12055 [Sphingomonas populi]|uniref:Uncharacterized protein n=1 Tax=Sphingomonas populi TaxID=2484750 RepID=A0A4Q6Y228_9SPHN|nr:hypothetical protein [Sphingomonas populi]RZF64272.1 hypothetical protein EWE75_12055 [Sphingomonas populi]
MSYPITGPILLPSEPALKTDTPAMLDWGGPLTPQNGGAVQTLMRLGTRHSLDFVMPPMLTEPHGRIWAAKLKLAKLFGALLPFGQDGFVIGAPGSPVVNGTGQSGMLLNMRGFTPRYTVKFGQAFSLVHLGHRFIYFAADQGTAGADGGLLLPIFPMLRAIPVDGDACEFGKPMIEGSLSMGGSNKIGQDRDTAPWSTFGTITITENE